MKRNATGNQILELLKQSYPKAKVALDFRSPWELLVAVILAAQCTDVRVNMVTPVLFSRFQTVGDMATADIKEVEKIIASCGFYHNKAKNIIAAAGQIVDKHGGVVPKTMGELVALPGVARKTANVVLGNAYGVIEGIAIDTHMIRLTQRLRLVDIDAIGGKDVHEFTKDGKKILDFKKDADPVKIENDLMNWLPKDEWLATTYRIVDHGRAVCKAQNPKCGECILQSLCPASRV